MYPRRISRSSACSSLRSEEKDEMIRCWPRQRSLSLQDLLSSELPAWFKVHVACRPTAVPNNVFNVWLDGSMLAGMKQVVERSKINEVARWAGDWSSGICRCESRARSIELLAYEKAKDKWEETSREESHHEVASYEAYAYLQKQQRDDLKISGKRYRLTRADAQECDASIFVARAASKFNRLRFWNANIISSLTGHFLFDLHAERMSIFVDLAEASVCMTAAEYQRNSISNGYHRAWNGCDDSNAAKDRAFQSQVAELQRFI